MSLCLATLTMLLSLRLRERERESERDRERQRDRERDRETERERDRDRERARDRELKSHTIVMLVLLCGHTKLSTYNDITNCYQTVCVLRDITDTYHTKILLMCVCVLVTLYPIRCITYVHAYHYGNRYLRHGMQWCIEFYR